LILNLLILNSKKRRASSTQEIASS